MLSNDDRAAIMQMIAEAKQELRHEIWDASNRNHSEKQSMKNDTAIAFVTLSEKGDIDEVTAAEHSAMFAPWEAGIGYAAGAIRSNGKKLYRCLQAHTSQIGWEPENTPSLWKVIGDPAEEWPQWSQPVGAGDAYQSGDKVNHGGSHWVSEVDNNVWDPGVYGWHNA